MQNWEHLLNVVGSLHIQPKKLTVDISRVRRWHLEQYSKFYRFSIFEAFLKNIFMCVI